MYLRSQMPVSTIAERLGMSRQAIYDALSSVAVGTTKEVADDIARIDELTKQLAECARLLANVAKGKTPLINIGSFGEGVLLKDLQAAREMVAKYAASTPPTGLETLIYFLRTVEDGLPILALPYKEG